MPDAVPEFLQDTFRSLIPLVVNAIIWTILGYGCVALTQTALPVLITGLLGMPLAALTSVPGIIIIVIIAVCYGQWVYMEQWRYMRQSQHR